MGLLSDTIYAHKVIKDNRIDQTEKARSQRDLDIFRQLNGSLVTTS